MAKASSKVLAEIYRQHHIPLPPITLQTLVQRGPRTTPEVTAQLQHGDATALARWKEQNATVIVQSAQLLHREVPIRLARRIVDLENLPGGLPDAPSIVTLREGLISSFDQMISFPKPTDLAGERAYMELQRKIRAEHATMQTNLADALRELDREPAGLAEILDGFYNSRIGIRMLVDQHIAAQNPVPGFAGIIADECSPVQLARDVIAQVTPMWEETLPGRALPAFRIVGEASATYRYIPQHISLILSEAIKNAVVNSLNATEASSSTPPPVDILVAGGSHGVCIKVSDRGGGMTRDQANALFSYVPASSRAATATATAATAYDPVSAALERRASGIDFQKSFGLRIASLYAQYFGGALSLMPMEGHGVDTYIYMNCLTEASQLNKCLNGPSADAIDGGCVERSMMLVTDDDPEAVLLQVPFAFIDLAPLSSVRSVTQPSLPGAVPDREPSVTRPHFLQRSASDNSSTKYPHEIGLRVLSSDHYSARTLRLVFPPARRPSRLDVYVAPATALRDRRSSVDPLSQYLSAAFESLGDPLYWPPESALHWPVSPTEATIPIACGHKPIAFIKLVLHGPHGHPDNPSHDVTCAVIELLGLFHLPSREISLCDDARTEQRSRPVVETPEDSTASIQRSLEAAGLPEALIRELLETAATPELPVTEVPVHCTALIPATCPPPLDPLSALESPFDVAMREFVARQACHNRLFASIMPAVLPSDFYNTTHGMSLAVPRIDRRDPNRVEAITTYTFGSFFTQCLVRDDGSKDDEAAVARCIESLRLAERLAPLLTLSGLAPELVFEGLIAVIVLALQSPSPLAVFHASLQLVRTLFQDRSIGVCFTSGFSTGRINTGLATVLDAVLASPHCWSLGSKTTVDRELLKTMRLFVAQHRTRCSFLQAVWTTHETKTNQDEHEVSSVCLNRLRVVRWLLQRHAEIFSVTDREAMRCFCDSTAATALARSPRDTKQYDVAQQCLRLLINAGSTKGTKETTELDVQLHSLRQHLHAHTQSPTPSTRDAPTDHVDHVPLFVAFPLADTQHATLVNHLRRYFQLHARPTALYPHVFTVTSLEDHGTNGSEFRMGNIVFRGDVVERTVPHDSFHRTIERHTTPFEFSSSATSTTTAVTKETSFARFRGTLEARTDVDDHAAASASVPPVVSSTEHATAAIDASMRSPAARPLSHGKLSRVVPVNEFSAAPSPVGDTPAAERRRTKEATEPIRLTPTPEPAAAPLVSSVVTSEPSKARASSAAPAPPLSTRGVKAEPPLEKTNAAAKTAPSGKTRTSQDGGCGVQ